EAPVLRDLPDRSRRHQAAGRAGRRPRDVGLGLPAPRRRVARLARVRAARDGTPARRRPPQDRLRERRAPLWLRPRRERAMKKTWRLYTGPDRNPHIHPIDIEKKAASVKGL